MRTYTERIASPDGLRWIKPAGSLGDAMVLSALLRARHQITRERFGIVRDPVFSSLFLGHPAVAKIAVPHASSTVESTEYWNDNIREPSDSYRRLSYLLFDELVGKRDAWVPIEVGDEVGLRGLPFKISPIVIASDADSPLRSWPLESWVELVALISKLTSVPIVQLGVKQQRTMAGCLNLSGRLNPRELIALIGQSQAVISVDPLAMHAAHMSGVPTIQLFGPQVPAIDGYPTQIKLHAGFPCLAECEVDDGASKGAVCARSPSCMQAIEPQHVVTAFSLNIVPLLRPDRLFADAQAC